MIGQVWSGDLRQEKGQPTRVSVLQQYGDPHVNLVEIP
jgi:hypothetical protein